MVSSEHMILAKNFLMKDKPLSVYLSEKIDGVPGIFGKCKITMSRQGKPINSVKHIEKVIDEYAPGFVRIIGELHIPGAPFKYSSGKVRKNEQNTDIHLGIWDIEYVNSPSLSYQMRFLLSESLIDTLYDMSEGRIFKIPTKREDFLNHDDGMEKIKMYFESLKVPFKERVLKFAPKKALSALGDPEGVIIRDARAGYERGRSWGLMRYVPKPTLDLRVCGIHEATANKRMEFLGTVYEKGEDLNAIGALWVNYKGTLVKVGPGNMTHKERRYYWSNPSEIVGKIVKVQYKTDPTYNALREPIYVCIRTDKDIADGEESEPLYVRG